MEVADQLLPKNGVVIVYNQPHRTFGEAKIDPIMKKKILHPEGVKNMHVLKNFMERLGYETVFFQEADADKHYRGPQTTMCAFVKK